MRQFDLNEYLEHPEKKVVTRDGHSVRIICTDADHSGLPVVYLIKLDRGESLGLCDEHGRTNPDLNACCDLFFASDKHEGWVNVYCGVRTVLGKVFRTKEEAIAESCHGCTDTVKIEWEE